ncbi:TetR family transcriptional regulator [Oceanobacillus sp. FSL K6-2867]|uniref:TetR/AcrR family transcriptional regulator n=1 Tax=Oceanobacillus sp. FSL K6-2867 TaxID=2954748 RepID=UPI0030DD2E06
MPTSKRTNKKKNLLIAAAEIVKEEGVVKLTLEAVAHRAGVSKGGLLYHYPSKEALIKGMVEDWKSNYFESIITMAKNDKKELGKWIRAYVQSTYSDFDNNKLMNSAIMAAMFFNPDLLNEFRREYDNLLTKLVNDGVDPIKTTIARLSIDGLWFSEIFGMQPLNKELQTNVYRELINMIEED